MKTKITVVAILAMALVMMIGCGLVSEVESIRLVNPPAASYKVGVDVPVDNFMVEVKISGNTYEWPLNDTRLTVEGLVNGRLDTATPGVKTLKITYMGVSITATYVVVGEDENVQLWSEMTEGDGVRLLEDLANGTLSGEYDLAGAQWPGFVVSEDLTITGTATIKNLVMTDVKAFANGISGHANSCAGLISRVEKNVTFKVTGNITLENVVIEHIDNVNRENAKYYGAFIGYIAVDAKEVVINNVVVDNATIKGNGSLGGIVGYSGAKSLTIDKCKVNASITGNNPVVAIEAEGEADKIGGIIGSCQKVATITNNEVTVVLAGTRNVGGIIGYIPTGSTVTNNTVKSGSIIAVSVDGAMNPKKGMRNAGGIIGSLAGLGTGDAVIEFSGNVVENGVVVARNTKYADSSAATYINFYGIIKEGVKLTIGEKVIEFKDYATQEAFIEAVNAYIAGLAA